MIGQQHLKAYLGGGKVGRGMVASPPAPIPPQRAALVKRIALNPKRAAAASWRAMSWPEKEARAQAMVNRTWARVAPLYGQSSSSPHPPVTFGLTSGPLGSVTGIGGPVEMAPGTVGFLAKPRILAPGARAGERERLMHEWAHHFQSPELINDPDEAHKEEAAELFASYWAHKIFGAQGMAKQGPLPYANRSDASADLAATYGPGYWRQRQFIATP